MRSGTSIQTRLGVVALVLSGTAVMGSRPASAAAASPSAIGNETVQGISVSPLYEQTGLVVAAATDLSCGGKSSDCVHLWVSHNGGNTWRKAAAADWDHGIP